jgi:hypothetical protein
MDPSRDIELLLVTGAGASAKFGLGDSDIPMMREWCRSLTFALRDVPNLLDLVGLNDQMGGEDFERALGEFLRRAAAFEHIAPLLDPIAKVRADWTVPARVDPTGKQEPSWPVWHANANITVHDTIERIRASLFQSFGPQQFALDHAADAFSTLLDALGIGSDSKWVWATTNYDVVPDYAVAHHGGIPDHGALRPPKGGQIELRVANLLDGAPRYVPILHLHGRVGWFRHTAIDADIEIDPSSITKTPQQHVPIVELPALGKTYDNTVTSLLWAQFREAVRRAQLVFVLGHSLNDNSLVEALRDADPNGLAIAVLADEDDPLATSPEGSALAEQARHEFTRAVRTPPIYFDKRFAGDRVPTDALSALTTAARS